MAGTTWKVEVKCFYIETKKLNKKGKPITQMVMIRKLFLKDKASFLDSGDYRIFVKKGKFTISVIPRIAQPIWSNPTGKAETWYKTPADIEWENEDGSITIERPYKRTDDPPMNESQILAWLTGRMGASEARLALHTLLTAEPEQRREAA